MRSFDGQKSDRQPPKRTAAEKQAQLRLLRQRLSSMKSHESPDLRASIERTIGELERELGPVAS